MDDLVRHAVAEPPLDLRRLGAAEQLRLAGVEAHDPPGELAALGVAEADAVARLKGPFHLRHPRREEALAALDERASRPRVDVEHSLRRQREPDPALPGGEAVGARREVGPDRFPAGEGTQDPGATA